MSGRTIPPLIGLLLVQPVFAATVLFVDVSSQRGIGSFQSEEGRGAGAAAEDYDGDGDIDIFVAQAAGLPHQLYRNLGDGSFEEIAAQVGLDVTTSGRTALWLDYDGDGDLDLIVANDDLANASSLHLYRQDEAGQFEDVTVQAGMSTPPNCYVPGCGNYHWAGICAGDINNDGYLDVYTAQYSPGPAHLFLNTGNGGFENTGAASGVGVPYPDDQDEWHFLHQSVMADFNDDGWLDIYVAVDVGFDSANQLWINQHNNTFLDLAAQAGLDNAMDDMGIALGDYDNDGDLDVYVTNIFEDGEHNVLFRNDSVGGQLSFTEVSAAMGVDDGGWGWGTTFLDVDLDGDLDLAATNGWRSGPWVNDASRFFTNQQEGLSFTNDSDAVQVNDTDWGSALVAADFDRDGDQDLLQACVTFYDLFTGEPTQFGPLRLWDNTPTVPPGNHYLVIQPRQAGPNRRAIGAIVRVEAGGRSMMRLISAGTSYLGQEPAEAFFGLGTASVADFVTVEWPDGTSTTIENVPADQIVTITPCTELADCADLDGGGVRDDACSWYACNGGVCASEPRGFSNAGQYGQADLGSPVGPALCNVDGVADGNDRFHALNCFSNANFGSPGNYPCEAAPPQGLNVDAGSAASCALDGVCDGNDAFHALNSFANANFGTPGGYPCSCSGSGPGPVAPPIEAEEFTGLLLRAPQLARPGALVNVDVYLEGGVKTLRGYQLHLGSSGGTRGTLELVDIAIREPSVLEAQQGGFETRPYSTQHSALVFWAAFNRSTHQMVAGLDAFEGRPAAGGAYLATFTYRVSADAAGTFVIDVLHGQPEAKNSGPGGRTFFFGYGARPIGLVSAAPAQIVVIGSRGSR